MNRHHLPPRPRRAQVSVLLGLVLLGYSIYGLTSASSRGSADIADPTRAPAASPSPRAAERVGPTTTAPSGVTTVPVPRPPPRGALAVRIPAVGIDSPLVELGLNPDGTLEVPRDFAVAGWYVNGAVPGQPGPAVIAGHIDSTTGPAVFYRLRELEPGVLVEVERDDGSVATFEVVAREQYDKDSFPTDRVYGPTQSPELRVITCGGAFDRSTGHYEDNVVVFGRLRGIAG